MAVTGKSKLLPIAGTLLVIAALACLLVRRNALTGRAPSSPLPGPAAAQAQPAATIVSTLADAQTPAAGPVSKADPALLAAIESQASAATDQGDMQQAVSMAPAMKVWTAMDAVIDMWPKYRDIRDELRRELSATIDLDKATVEELRKEASRLEAAFWDEEGYQLPQGYREAFKARLLLETAHERDPGNLAVADELAEAMMVGTPLDSYDSETKDLLPNRELVLGLRALVSETFLQARKEVEQGREFTWADFARAADYCELWVGRDSGKAAEAFEWACSHTSGCVLPKYQEDVLAALKSGCSFGFGIYDVPAANYPQEYVYSRRLPSFRGPDPEGRGLTPRWRVGAVQASPAGLADRASRW